MLTRLLDVDRNSALLVLSNFIWGVGNGLYAAIWPLFIAGLGASPAEVGLALSLTTAVSVVVFIPGAGITHRLGRRRTMILGWMMGPASSVVFAVAGKWEQLLPGIVLLALVGLQVPAYLGYIAIAARGRDLARVYSLMIAAVSFGAVLSSPIGGRLADLVDMHLLFWVVGLAYLASAGCLLFLDELDDSTHRPHDERPAAGPPDVASDARANVTPLAVEPPTAAGALRRLLAGYAAVLEDRRLMAALGVQLLLMAGANLAQPLAPNWLVGTYGYSRTQIGALGAVAAAATVGWGLALGRLSSRRGASSAVLVSAALVALGALAMLGASTLLVAVLAHVLRGAFAALRAVSNGLVAAQLHPPDVRSAAEVGRAVPRGHAERGFAVYSTLLNGALTLSTFAAGLLYQMHAALPFALSAASIVPVALLVWATAPRSRRPTVRIGSAIA